jgi:hypothetical protein
MRRFSPLSLFAPLALLACAPLLGTPYATSRHLTINEEIALVSRVRRAPAVEPVPIHELDDAAFLTAFHDAEGDGTILSAFGAAFGVSDAEVKEATSAIVDDRIDGFYSFERRELFVRRNASPGTLAHEVEHALQDQRFGVAKLRRSDMDGSMAARALMEGDATLTAFLVRGDELGLSHAEAVARASRYEEWDAEAGSRRAAGLREGEKSHGLRAAIEWPYLRGTTFVADLVRAGGWPLVDAAMRSPPSTTEQVLHLEKYLAGEQPIAVTPPSPPEGWTVVGSGRLGELATRSFLAQCLSDSGARDAASGWGGDALTSVRRGPSFGILWATAWDDEPSAARFERALRARRECGKAPFVVRRDGARVVFIQGIGGADAIAASLLTTIDRAPPPRPPFGPIAPPPRAAISSDYTGHGSLDGDVFVDEDIGIRAPLHGLVLREDSPDWNLVAGRDGIMVAIQARWSPPSPALQRAIVDHFVASVRRAGSPRDGYAFDEGTEPVALGWSLAEARTVTFVDNRQIHLVFAPACDGKMTYVFAMLWGPLPGSDEVPKRWLKSVDAHGAGASLACKAVQAMARVD